MTVPKCFDEIDEQNNHQQQGREEREGIAKFVAVEREIAHGWTHGKLEQEERKKQAKAEHKGNDGGESRAFEIRHKQNDEHDAQWKKHEWEFIAVSDDFFSRCKLLFDVGQEK